MPRPYTNPGPHPPITPASKASLVEIEHLVGDAIAYRLSGGPWRVIAPAPYGIYNVLRQLSAVVGVESRSSEDAESIAYLERELHEDIIAYEERLVDRENARLYACPYPPSLVREPDTKASSKASEEVQLMGNIWGTSWRSNLKTFEMSKKTTILITLHTYS